MSKKNFTVTTQDLTASMASATPTPLIKTPNPETIERAVNLVMASTEKASRQKTGKNKGLPPSEERVSFVLEAGQYEKIALIAYWDRKTVKQTVIDIFNNAIQDYESKNGTIKNKLS